MVTVIAGDNKGVNAMVTDIDRKKGVLTLESSIENPLKHLTIFNKADKGGIQKIVRPIHISNVKIRRDEQ